MSTFREIIDLWPSLQTFSEDIAVKYGTAQVMRHRDSIPSEYWMDVSRAAEHRGIKGVTLEALAKIKAKGRKTA